MFHDVEHVQKDWSGCRGMCGIYLPRQVRALQCRLDNDRIIFQIIMCEDPPGFSNLVHDRVCDGALKYEVLSQTSGCACWVTCLVETLRSLSGDDVESTG